MWIKKVSTSLYMSVLLRMVVAAIISILIFSTLFLVIEVININRDSKLSLQEKQELTKISNEIQSEIARENMTFAEAERIDWSSQYGKVIFIANEYNIDYFYNSEIELNDGVEVRDIYESAAIVEVEFADVPGFLIIDSLKGKTEVTVYYGVATFISIIAFFILSIRLFMPIISYIKKIGEGVNIIATEDIKYKIPVRGKNELSELATKINNMGEIINENMEHEKQVELGQRMLITNISHDLRTPLTSIIGYMDLAKSSLTETDKAYSYVQTAKNNSVRLEKSINDLFTYSKLISKDMTYHMTKVNINLILQQILELKKCPYEYFPSNSKPYIHVDMDKFHRMVDNLLSNAEKYGNAENKITVITVETENDVSIIIENTTEDDLSDKIHLLTNRLYTAKEDRNNTSTGLGLSIVEELAKAMDGKFQIEYQKPTFTAKLTFGKVLE